MTTIRKKDRKWTQKGSRKRKVTAGLIIKNMREKHGREKEVLVRDPGKRVPGPRLLFHVSFSPHEHKKRHVIFLITSPECLPCIHHFPWSPCLCLLVLLCLFDTYDCTLSKANFYMGTERSTRHKFTVIIIIIIIIISGDILTKGNPKWSNGVKIFKINVNILKPLVPRNSAHVPVRIKWGEHEV